MHQCNITHMCFAMCDYCKFFTNDFVCTNPASTHINERVDPTDYCDKFYCYIAAREDEAKKVQDAALMSVTSELTDLWVKED